jgi:hypothetical protein
MRGVLIDISYRNELIRDYQNELYTLEDHFKRLLYDGLGLSISWRSNKDLLGLFYDTLKLPKQFKGPRYDEDGEENNPTVTEPLLNG